MLWLQWENTELLPPNTACNPQLCFLPHWIATVPKSWANKKRYCLSNAKSLERRINFSVPATFECMAKAAPPKVMQPPRTAAGAGAFPEMMASKTIAITISKFHTLRNNAKSETNVQCKKLKAFGPKMTWFFAEPRGQGVDCRSCVCVGLVPHGVCQNRECSKHKCQ